ncbi:MAG TPA: hypothetical protein VF896_17495 [Anaerolineales bacterium]
MLQTARNFEIEPADIKQIFVHSSFIGLAREGQQPTIWIDGFWDRREMRRVTKLHARWLVTISEGQGLVGSFKVVEVDVGSSDVDHAGQVLWRIEQLTFILEISVIAFDEGVLVGSLGWVLIDLLVLRSIQYHHFLINTDRL